MKTNMHQLQSSKRLEMSKTCLIVILCIFVAFGCKKEDQPTLTENLSKSSWRKTQILISADSVAPDTIPNIEVLSGACKADNIWSFDASNNTFTLDEGATKCNPSDAQTKDHGIIQEQENGKKLLVDGDGTNEIWEIESFSAAAFRVSYFGRNSSNQLVKFRVTFSKI